MATWQHDQYEGAWRQWKTPFLTPNHTSIWEGVARVHLSFEEIQVSIENLKIGDIATLPNYLIFQFENFEFQYQKYLTTEKRG